MGGNPVNYFDSSGLFIDAFADIGFIAYDLFRLTTDNVFGSCNNLGENLGALGADVGGLFIPGATGLGLGVRATKKGTTVIGHLPNTPGVAKKIDANYLKLSKDWNFQKQGEFIKEVISRGDDVLIGTSIRQGPSVLKREIKQLVKQGYRPKQQGSKWLTKQ